MSANVEEMAALQPALSDPTTAAQLEAFRNLRNREQRNAFRQALGLAPLPMPQGPDQPALRLEWRQAQEQIVQLEKLLVDLDKTDMRSRGEVAKVLSDLLKALAQANATVEAAATSARGQYYTEMQRDINETALSMAESLSQIALDQDSDAYVRLSARKAQIRQLADSRDASGRIDPNVAGRLIQKMAEDLTAINDPKSGHAYMLGANQFLTDTLGRDSGINVATLAEASSRAGLRAAQGSGLNDPGRVVLQGMNAAGRAQAVVDEEVKIKGQHMADLKARVRTPGGARSAALYGDVGEVFSDIMDTVIEIAVDPMGYAVSHGLVAAGKNKERADVRAQISRLEKQQADIEREAAQRPILSSADAWQRAGQQPAMQRALAAREAAGLPGGVRAAAKAAERAIATVAKGREPSLAATVDQRAPAVNQSPQEVPAPQVLPPVAPTVPVAPEEPAESTGALGAAAPVTVQERGRLADQRILELLGYTKPGEKSA